MVTVSLVVKVVHRGLLSLLLGGLHFLHSPHHCLNLRNVLGPEPKDKGVQFLLLVGELLLEGIDLARQFAPRTDLVGGNHGNLFSSVNPTLGWAEE